MTEKKALLKLLEDEDQKIATIAIGKLVQYGPDLFPDLRDMQESQNPLLRMRVHQLEAIIEKKIHHNDFIQRVKQGEIRIWEDLIYINSIFYTELKPSELQKVMDETCAAFGTEFDTKKLCSFMKEKSFYVPKNDVMDSDLNLIGSALYNGEGSPLILCVIAQFIAKRFGHNYLIALHKGHHCLIDQNKMLIEPVHNWKISPLKEGTKAHGCSEQNLILTLIANLYLSSLVEGHLRNLKTFSSMMAQLSNMQSSDFPYPVGQQSPNTLNVENNETR